MPPQNLVIELLSDTAISSGLGTPGVVDTEVVRDETGLPFIPGKVIHGLLRDAWLTMRDYFPELDVAAGNLLGSEGQHSSLALLRIGDALLPEEVRQWANYAVNREVNLRPLQPELILRSLTDIRRQTAQSRETGGPEDRTLRMTRVVLRGTVFTAPLQWLIEDEPPSDIVRCLALSALGTRHMGLSRNRGLGFVRVTLDASPERTELLAQGEAV